MLHTRFQLQRKSPSLSSRNPCLSLSLQLCKASLPAMLESLLASPWYLISSDALRPDIAYMETAFAPAAVKDPDHVNIAFFA
jgi:hypothetical protein